MKTTKETPRNVLWDSLSQIHTARGQICQQAASAKDDMAKLQDLAFADDALRTADRLLTTAIIALGQIERARKENSL